jgi:hypothetical protein
MFTAGLQMVEGHYITFLMAASEGWGEEQPLINDCKFYIIEAFSCSSWSTESKK